MSTMRPEIGRPHRTSFIIVANAGRHVWSYYFDRDPVGGLTRDYSYGRTDPGKAKGIKEVYHDLNEAEADCGELNGFNPLGSFEVCPLIPGEISESVRVVPPPPPELSVPKEPDPPSTGRYVRPILSLNKKK